MAILFLIAEITALFFLSKRLTETIFLFVVKLTRSRPIAITVTTLLLFPGTVIHELSHLFTAEILGVRTGKLTLAPEAIRSNEVQAGSVTIAKTGPFRRVLIGMAPLFTGLVTLTAISYYVPLSLLSFYLLFSISNSLFPSKLDMQDAPGPIIATLLLFAATYATGIRLTLSGQLLDPVVQSLALVLAVNAVLLLIIQLLIVVSASLQNFKKG